jgi:hypothetical protein
MARIMICLSNETPHCAHFGSVNHAPHTEHLPHGIR